VTVRVECGSDNGLAIRRHVMGIWEGDLPVVRCQREVLLESSWEVRVWAPSVFNHRVSARVTRDSLEMNHRPKTTPPPWVLTTSLATAGVYPPALKNAVFPPCWKMFLKASRVSAAGCSADWTAQAASLAGSPRDSTKWTYPSRGSARECSGRAP
jgi:hypothetical protein